MRPDGWYQDPTHEHELRYVSGDEWTAFVSDQGHVLQEPPPPRRRRWPWFLAGGLLLAVGAVVLGWLTLVVLGRTLDEQDVYVADLSSVQSGFPTSTDAHAVREWVPDGYRMTVTAPHEGVAGGITSPTSHLVLAIKVDVVPLTVPPGSEFGVQCWQDESAGYGLLVASDGSVRLVDGSVLSGAVRTLDRAYVGPLRPGQQRSLTIACDVVGGTAVLAGYVDGARVVAARPENRLGELRAGGMVGTTADEAPASWLVVRYERMGVHNMPPGWSKG